MPCLSHCLVLHVEGIHDAFVVLRSMYLKGQVRRWCSDSHRVMYDNVVEQVKLWLIEEILHTLGGAVAVKLRMKQNLFNPPL
jgi:hypothetical protein